MIEEESTCATNKFGNKIWRNKAGEYHRGNDLPAIIRGNGDRGWYVNGVLHRDNDLPAIIWPDGRQEWWVNGKLHRINGKPAVIYYNDKLEWWINGVDITKQVLAWHKTNNIKYPPTTPEEEEDLAVLFKLAFG